MSESIARNILQVKQYKIDSWSYFSSTWWKFHQNESPYNALHTACHVDSMEVTEIYSQTFFGKKFRESNCITKKLLDCWFHEKNFDSVHERISLQQCSVEKREFLSQRNFFREINSNGLRKAAFFDAKMGNFFVKPS